MLQDAAKRLAYTAKQVKLVESAQGVGGNFDYVWLGTVAFACLQAIGRHDMVEELEQVFRERATPPPVAWLVDFMRPVGHTPFDPLIPWAFQHLRRVGQINDGEALELANELRAASGGLLAWYLATKPDLTKLDLGQALDAAEAWADAQAAKVVYEFPDGWTMRRLMTKRELEVEGKRMRHCVGGEAYCEKAQTGTSIIYSLRDPDDVPHATLEWLVADKHFSQIFGPDDEPITDDVRPYVIEFITRVHGGAVADLITAGVDPKGLLHPGAHLVGVDLMNMDLRDVDLTGVDLTGANLADADLRDVSLRNAVLTDANLYRTNLRNADLRGATRIRASMYETRLVHADLTSANLTAATMIEADLTNANLFQADLESASLGDANLRDANLDAANLRGAYLYGADLFNASIYQTIWTGATMPDGTKIP